MARLFQSGFELNTGTTLIEWSATVGVTVGTTNVRSGTYAGRVSGLVSATAQQFRVNLGASYQDVFARFYLYLVTLPTGQNMIFILNDGNNLTSPLVYITVGASGNLRLFDEDGQIGILSSALSLNTWYRIDVQSAVSGGAGACVVNARIDGVEFAAGTTRSISASTLTAIFGGNLSAEAQTQGEWWFDDVAINNTSGSFQNTYPGSGKIIHLSPDAAGDVNGFLTGVGGTAGAGNNFTRVNENPPNDATSYNASPTANAQDLFNVGASGIAAGDTVNVVAVAGRIANLVLADATTAIKFEIEKTSGGTITQSAAIIPNTTTWRTNGVALVTPFPIVTYQDPDAANWTSTTLDSMQIGYILSTANVQSIAVTNVWASVDYTPAATNTAGFLQFM